MVLDPFNLTPTTGGGTQVYTRGSGFVYFSELDSNDNPTGLSYAGLTPAFSFSQGSDTTDGVQSPDGAVPVDVIADVTTYAISAGCTLMSLSVDNVKRFFLGETKTISVAASAVTDEEHVASPGKFIQLGSDADNPMGVTKTVSSVSVKAESSGGTFTTLAPANYTLHDDAGMIFFKTSWSATGPTNVKVTYTPTAETKTVIEVPESPDRKPFAIRYYEDQNIEPKAWNIFIPKAVASPTGTFDIKARTGTVSIPLEIDILKSTNAKYPQTIYLDFVDQTVAA